MARFWTLSSYCLTLIFLLYLMANSAQAWRYADREVTVHFSNDSVKPRRCHFCIGELHFKTAESGAKCGEFRRLMAIKAGKSFFDNFERKAWKKPNAEEIKNATDTLNETFTITCPFGVEDCYKVTLVDARKLGSEERGCGIGPRTVDAEPHEGCTEEYWNPEGDGGHPTLYRNCVCENKDLCNGGSFVRAKFWEILALVLLPLLASCLFERTLLGGFPRW